MTYTFRANRGATVMEIYENEYNVVQIDIDCAIDTDDPQHAEYHLDKDELFNLIGALHTLQNKLKTKS